MENGKFNEYRDLMSKRPEDRIAVKSGKNIRDRVSGILLGYSARTKGRERVTYTDQEDAFNEIVQMLQEQERQIIAKEYELRSRKIWRGVSRSVFFS